VQTVTLAHEKLLRISDVAARLDCSEATVRRLIWNGQLKAHQFNGKNTSVRVFESVLEEWLQGRFAGSSGDEAA
jgi:excisionase family DNA binding protein